MTARKKLVLIAIIHGESLPESLERVSKLLEGELVKEATGNYDPNRSATLEVQQYCKDGSSSWKEISAT